MCRKDNMWKIFKSLPRVFRQQNTAPARSSHVGTISAEEEEGTRLQCSLIHKSPTIYNASQICIKTEGFGDENDKHSPGGDHEWQKCFRNYYKYATKCYLLESLSLGTALALGVNLINYHQLLANRDSQYGAGLHGQRRGSLSCLLQVAFSMPKTTRQILPDKQQDTEHKSDHDDTEQQKLVARKAFEEACDSFMSLVNTYTGVSRNVSGIEKSNQGLEEQAFKDWQEASSLGYTKADYNLGVCYEQGRGIKKSLTRAAQHYKTAALAGHPKAQYNLAMLIISGKFEVTDIQHSPSELLQLAAAQGLPQAQTYLGVKYATSEEKDYGKAVSMFEGAADQNDVNAQYQLAICYEQGLGVEQNQCKAAKLFSKAAKAGHAKAAYNLGVFYENGVGGLPVNTQTAKQLYRKSADQGVTNAKYNLHRLEAIQAVNELTVRERTSPHKLTLAKGIHVSLSSPNLVALSKSGQNPSETQDEINKKDGFKFNLNLGKFGKGSFGSFARPQRELSSSSCSLGQTTVQQNTLGNCVAF